MYPCWSLSDSDLVVVVLVFCKASCYTKYYYYHFRIRQRVVEQRALQNATTTSGSYSDQHEYMLMMPVLWRKTYIKTQHFNVE